MREVVPQILPLLRTRRPAPQLLIVFMDYDVHTVEDVERLAKELNLRPTNHVCSRAVYNAMRGSPDITAGMEVCMCRRSVDLALCSTEAHQLSRW